MLRFQQVLAKRLRDRDEDQEIDHQGSIEEMIRGNYQHQRRGLLHLNVDIDLPTESTIPGQDTQPLMQQLSILGL